MKPLLSFVLIPFLAACSAKGAYPSLAPRAFELPPKAAPASPEQPVAPALLSDPQIVARISSALALARSGEAAFQAALPATQRAVSAGRGGRGSEGWIGAQMAISRLERTREPVQQALADLDQIARQILFGPPSADRETLDAAMQTAQHIDRGQLDIVQGLIRSAGR